ncbi:MAG: peptidylprolyl isomerase [Candidatus Poseidoniales archaeon]|nr:peptidylprolyl isomerase [Candidatus Poseidoniales archaeon]
MGKTSRQRVVLSCILVFLLLPISVTGEEEPAWKSNGIDPTTWTDGPVVEDTPMQNSYFGDPVFAIDVTYTPGHFEDEVSGTIVIELFPQWAPVTVGNMIEHIEDGLYDGIFFHRVINDFVTQSGDPECKTNGVYVPGLPAQCGSGGTGETIPLEHNENLSHVDGAIGMARGQEEDSADSQWYIAETEAHGLDPENRDDGGYATFGIVRDGMSHVRAIAEVPTSDDPTGTDVDNPFSTAGRPIYEAKINKIEMIGVADPNGELSAQASADESETGSGVLIAGVIVLIILGAGFVYVVKQNNTKQDAPIYDAELIEEKDTSNTT